MPLWAPLDRRPEGLWEGPSVSKLFTPPQITYKIVLRGRSLIYQYPESQTVWKDSGGVWHALSSPPSETLDAALVFYTRPTVVSDSIAAELVAAGIGTVT